MAPKGNKGKKKTIFNPEIPPVEGGENLGSIFAAAQAEMEAEPSSFATANLSKRPQTNTTSSLRNYQPEQDPGHYWSCRYLEKVRDYPSDMTFHNFAMIFVGFLGELQTDYTDTGDPCGIPVLIGDIYSNSMSKLKLALWSLRKDSTHLNVF